MRVPFSPPDISELEINEVADALRSGWITTGPRTKQLEKEIAEWIGVNKCVCLNSQTACAEMALHILGIGAGDLPGCQRRIGEGEDLGTNAEFRGIGGLRLIAFARTPAAAQSAGADT